MTQRESSYGGSEKEKEDLRIPYNYGVKNSKI